MNKTGLIFLVPTVVVLIPLTAMLIKADGWAWSATDFIFAWLLIAGAIAGFQLMARKAAGLSYRIAAAMTVFGGLLLIWSNGAVGIMGSEDNPANLMYTGVLVVGLAGVLLARREPLGMAWTAGAMAAAQFLVPVIALIAGNTDFSPGLVPVLGFNACFVMIFAAAALLFYKSARGFRRLETN